PAWLRPGLRHHTSRAANLWRKKVIVDTWPGRPSIPARGQRHSPTRSRSRWSRGSRSSKLLGVLVWVERNSRPGYDLSACCHSEETWVLRRRTRNFDGCSKPTDRWCRFISFDCFLRLSVVCHFHECKPARQASVAIHD